MFWCITSLPLSSRKQCEFPLLPTDLPTFTSKRRRVVALLQGVSLCPSTKILCLRFSFASNKTFSLTASKRGRNNPTFEIRGSSPSSLNAIRIPLPKMTCEDICSISRTMHIGPQVPSTSLSKLSRGSSHLPARKLGPLLGGTHRDTACFREGSCKSGLDSLF